MKKIRNRENRQESVHKVRNMTAKKSGKRITREEFIRKAAVGAAAVATGLSGTARAALPGTRTGNPDTANIDDSDPAKFEVYPANSPPPSGMMTAFPKTKYPNGSAFSIDDDGPTGPRLPVRFYMKATTGYSEGPVSGYSANIPIDISASSNALQVGTAIATAINGVGNDLRVNSTSETADTGTTCRVYLAYNHAADAASIGDGLGNDVSISNISMPDGSFSPWTPGSPKSNDVRNVQWAINNVQRGGTVVLKQYAANTANPLNFNFGIIGRVEIVDNDVTLQGEFRGSRKELTGVGYGGWIQDGTTIKGGAYVVRVYKRAPNPGPSFAVKDIIFDGPRNRAFGVGDLHGTGEISGCKIKNLMRTAGFAVTGAFWMIIHGGLSEDEVNSLTGTLKIKNNFLGKPVNPKPFPSTEPDPNNQANNINSLMHVSNCRLDLEISGNEIEDCIWAGFLVMLNQRRSLIARNKITKTRSNAQGGAIGVGVYPSGAGSIFTTNYSYEGGADVIDNEVVIGSETDSVSTVNSGGIIVCNYPPNQFPYAPNGTGPESKQVPAPPSYQVSGNRITMHRNPATKALNLAAIAILGSASNVTCRDNVVLGEATYGIQLSKTALPSFMVTPNADAFVTGNTVYSNDLRGFVGGLAQVFLDAGTLENAFKNNDYGANGSFDSSGAFHAGLAGTYVRASNGNSFVNENFWGDYAGVMDADGNPVFPPHPCMWFAAGSSGNTVTALKKGQALQGFDICTQVFFAVNSADNTVQGYEKCGAVPQKVVTAMMAREAEFAAKEKKRCEDSGGSWDEITQTCEISDENTVE